MLFTVFSAAIGSKANHRESLRVVCYIYTIMHLLTCDIEIYIMEAEK